MRVKKSRAGRKAARAKTFAESMRAHGEQIVTSIRERRAWPIVIAGIFVVGAGILMAASRSSQRPDDMQAARAQSAAPSRSAARAGDAIGSSTSAIPATDMSVNVTAPAPQSTP